VAEIECCHDHRALPASRYTRAGGELDLGDAPHAAHGVLEPHAARREQRDSGDSRAEHGRVAVPADACPAGVVGDQDLHQLGGLALDQR
jgi:hypothetical protein